MNAIVMVSGFVVFCTMLGLFYAAVKTLSVSCFACGAFADMMLCSALLQDSKMCPLVLLGSLACVAVVFYVRKKACETEKE